MAIISLLVNVFVSRNCNIHNILVDIMIHMIAWSGQWLKKRILKFTFIFILNLAVDPIIFFL
jgi:hypothetical protein